VRQVDQNASEHWAMAARLNLAAELSGMQGILVY
jgi:hypothetical protein